MDTNLAGLAPSLTRSRLRPEWVRNEDRYYARMSPDLPTLAPVWRVLRRLASLPGTRIIRPRRVAVA